MKDFISYLAELNIVITIFFLAYMLLFRKDSNSNNLTHILEHEACHVRLLHSVDRIMAEIMLCFNWFNPAIWMLRKTIVVNHEYQADNRVIEQGSDHNSYQLTILNQYIGNVSISNQFSNPI